jgi:hypothetical protein
LPSIQRPAQLLPCRVRSRRYYNEHAELFIYFNVVQI